MIHLQCNYLKELPPVAPEVESQGKNQLVKQPKEKLAIGLKQIILVAK